MGGIVGGGVAKEAQSHLKVVTQMRQRIAPLGESGFERWQGQSPRRGHAARDRVNEGKRK